MPPLTAKGRAELPDSAFAYIDSTGRRRLPINDKAHVRNALARFNQTRFEDENARDRARTRLLRAAKKHGIVPIGFMHGQLAAGKERKRKLPSGFVTFLLADVEDSTGLVQRLGGRYGDFLNDLRTLLRSSIESSRGFEIDARADELFAVFELASRAVEAALKIQRRIAGGDWPDDFECKLRIGLHSGEPQLTGDSYVGLPVHTAARVCSAANGGQILLSGAVREAIERAEAMKGVSFRHLGVFALQGLPEPEALFQLEAEGLSSDFPAPRARQAQVHSAI